ncbi:hypothetical protein CDD83_7451 [Cordyceps sp. RAO-2017]|nr:hypothetical protein CDD83_7451 [Cordyceps sp. RAO-2017]
MRSHPDVRLESVEGEVRCGFEHALPWRRITDRRELEQRTVCLFYSSGTTGLPKGVRLSHANLVSEVFIIAWLSRQTYDRWHRRGKGFVRRSLAHLPVAHVAGAKACFLTAFLEAELVYWMPTFNFPDFVRYVAELGVTSLLSVPPVYASLAKSDAVTDQLSRVRHAIVGAAPMSGEQQQAASSKLAPDTLITQHWGLSETTGSVTHASPDRRDVLGSVSCLIPNVEMRLVDDEDNDVPPGSPGEALLKGPVITKGYHNNPEADKTAFTHDGWFRTGDVVLVRGDLLYVIDRKKELIKYKGLQVAPAEVEGVLCAHPGVADAAVVGVPQGDTEVPRAYVALAPGARGALSEADLVDFVRGRVAAHKQLRGGVVLVDAVPRSASGKILRKNLRELLRGAAAAGGPKL